MGSRLVPLVLLTLEVMIEKKCVSFSLSLTVCTRRVMCSSSIGICISKHRSRINRTGRLDAGLKGDGEV